MSSTYSLLLSILLLAASSNTVFNSESMFNSTLVAIYSGSGSWNTSVIAFEKFLDWKGVEWVEIDENDINNNDLSQYNIIFFPGGWAGTYRDVISEEGINNIRDSIRDGTGYIGICAGAYFAADKVVFEGITYDYPLKLFDGVAYGPLSTIASWNNYTMTILDINKSNPINIYEPPEEYMLYYGGPCFQPYNQDIEVIATWREYYDEPAIISFEYGQGNVILFGSHPEIEEDSIRDGSDFADDFNDNGSDWYLLWVLLDYLIYGYITEPPELDISIEKPEFGYLYFLDTQLFYIGETIIIGGIDIEVSVENVSYYEIKDVTFYIDDEIRYIDYEPPYTWLYSERGFSRHIIRITIISFDGKSSYAEEEIWMINLG